MKTSIFKGYANWNSDGERASRKREIISKIYSEVQ